LFYRAVWFGKRLPWSGLAMNSAGASESLRGPGTTQIRLMKNTLVGVLSLAWVHVTASAGAGAFDDIQFWAGSGTNRAALVIDWHDGKAPSSLVWGYRWDGSATGYDMFQAVVRADPRLFAHLAQFTWGSAIVGIGYDRNHSGSFAVNPPLAFDPAGFVIDTGATNASDARLPDDLADHFVEGWNTGFWAYFTRASQSEPWASSWVGAADRILTDGAWDGLSFAPNFVSSEPADPVPAMASPFAIEVVAAQGPFGAAPYDDPASLLGRPSTNYYDPLGGWSGGTTVRRVKLVEPAHHLDPGQTHKLITTVNEGASVVVRFEQPILDDPAHPYGIDLLVFGNAYYLSSGFVNDSTDMNTLMLTSGAFIEPIKVSVSPGYTGKLGQDPTNSATWDWYRYENGPYADTAFPTHAYRWNRTNSTWSSDLMDFTKPVNPVFGPVLDAGGLSAADAIDLYDGSGGGTGFDLAESGFTSIQYIKVEGLAGFAAGEVDALASVRPMVLGDSLTIAPANLTNNTATLRFQRGNRPSETALALSFTGLSEMARIATAPLADTSVLTPYGQVLNGGSFACAPLRGSNLVSFMAELRLGAGAAYQGNGQDLTLLRKDGAGWEVMPFTYEPASRSALVTAVTNASTLALIQVQPPRLGITITVDGLGNTIARVRFAALPGWTYTLERTADFLRWDRVASATPSSLEWISMEDAEPAGRAFYRVRVSRP